VSEALSTNFAHCLQVLEARQQALEIQIVKKFEEKRMLYSNLVFNENISKEPNLKSNKSKLLQQVKLANNF
jgi:hypothetical protein